MRFVLLYWGVKKEYSTHKQYKDGVPGVSYQSGDYYKKYLDAAESLEKRIKDHNDTFVSPSNISHIPEGVFGITWEKVILH